MTKEGSQDSLSKKGSSSTKDTESNGMRLTAAGKEGVKDKKKKCC